MKKKYCHYLFSFFLLALMPVVAIASEEALSKATIAILTPKVIGKAPSSYNEEELIAKLETALHATKRFEVLSRDKAKLASIREEQEFSASSFSSGEAAHSGKLLAANYLIHPTITSFSFGRSSRAIPNIDNKYFIRDSGGIVLELQVTDTSNGSIKANFSVKDGFSTSEKIANSSRGGPSRSYFSRMAENLGSQLANQLLETIFPTKVLRVVGNDIWLNRGANSGVKQNQEMVLYRPGEVLIDPYTKENLGTTEETIGKLKIIRVNPKVSVGNMLDADKSLLVREGDIVRTH